MGRVRILGCGAGLLACLALAGCGGGSGGGGSESSTSPPIIQRGIKGESVLEVATNAHISADDCARLADLAEKRLGTKLTRHSRPSAPHSHCTLAGAGTEVNVYLDTAHGAHIRYQNRIVETVQFNTDHPSGLPQAVPRVGEKAPGNVDASWIPALGSLLAVRGNRWLTVTIAVAGRSERELRGEAAVLAIAGFRLTAE